MGNRKKPLGLVADIGGTNGRFALAYKNGGDFELWEQRDYRCAEFTSFAAMVEDYLSHCDQKSPLRAVIAVAGPVSDNCCAMTNGPFEIDGGQLQKQGMFSSCLILNDFAALAASLPVLQQGELIQIGGQQREQAGAKLVVGPGTGLGAAFFSRDNTKVKASSIVLEGEGGHMAFAPFDELEIEILRWFSSKYGRVSFERLLSGQGLEDLHEALAAIEDRPVRELIAEEIMAKGLASKGNERNSLLRFCAILGSYMGDLALAGGCWGGVYIGGGIVPRMPDLLEKSPFRQRFEAKGRFSAKMADTPSWLITHKAAALLGAAWRLSRL